MDDVISRQAAIDALAKFVPYAICDESTESYTNGLTDAYNLILQLPSAQPEPHWIPCSERLPEERGFYLTTTKDKAVYCDYWNEDNFDRTEMVIAWMPLPEPYKTESEDKE